MKKMILGADHAGFKLKEAVKKYLGAKGYTLYDLSPVLIPGDDYPLIAKKAVKLLKASSYKLHAVLVCGSGHGMEIEANRFKGIRAIVARSPKDAMVSEQEDHSNILILGGRMTKPALAKKIVSGWLKAKPSKAKRHLRRIKELDRV